MKLSKYIDHTALKADTSIRTITTLCEEALVNDFASVCVNSSWVNFCSNNLKDSDVKVCAVVGFPLGAMSTAGKVFEAKQAIEDGATEIDMVINVGRLIDGDFNYVQNDIAEIKKAIGNNILKVIFETCLLTNELIKKATEISLAANADFVKTSTGFSTGGATIEAVKIMIDNCAGKAEVKASGGIKTPEDLKMYIDLGVKRIGTSSGVKLIAGQDAGKGY